MADDHSAIEDWPDDVRSVIAAAEKEAAELAATAPRPVALRDSVPGYEIVSELGRGGMGVVYRAYQLSTKRTVALKVLLAGEFASPSARTRFQREVELTARLQHQGIVRVLESGLTSAGQQYYAMDYVDAAAFDHWLSIAQPDVPKTLTAFIEICAAVDHAHQHGVIHRDLKPSNVLIDSEGQPHILDFGLAKSSDHIELTTTITASVSMPGQIVGTLRYLSPEQAAGKPEEIDARSDVYSLGVMLFESLTGSLPYDMTGSPSAVIQRIIEAPPTRPSSLSNRVNGELETIILKAMEKEKARRYQSVRELGEDLGHYLRGEPILAKPPSSLYRLRKRLWRNRLRISLVLAAAVLASIGVWGDRWWRSRTLEQNRVRKLANARHLLLEVQRDVEAGHTEEALMEAEGALGQYPDLPEAHLVWALAKFLRGRETGNLDFQANAATHLRLQLADHPHIWAYRALRSEMCREQHNLGEADELQARADHDAARTPEARYLNSFATMDINKAARLAEEAVKGDPSYALAWERLVYLYLQLERFDLARQAARKLIVLGEDGFTWMRFEGDVFLIQGHYDEAAERYTSLPAASPDRQWEALNCRALAFLCNRKYEDAVKDYSEAWRIVGSTVPFILYRRATPLWILGELDGAAEDYVAFMRLHPSPTYAPVRLFLVRQQQARLLEEEGRAKQAQDAREAARNALAILHGMAASETWLERIHNCLIGKLEPSELVLAAKTPVEKCEAYYYAGEICLLAGRRDEARKWFSMCKATELVLDKHNFPRMQLDPMNEYHLALWRLDTLRDHQEAASQPN